jgi:hypothetical protein
MSFFSRGNNRFENRGNRGNRGRGPNAFGKRSRNKRMRFSIHFDENYEEFNQLVQTSYLSLTGHRAFHPPHPLVIPPLQLHLSIADIPEQPICNLMSP